MLEMESTITGVKAPWIRGRYDWWCCLYLRPGISKQCVRSKATSATPGVWQEIEFWTLGRRDASCECTTKEGSRRRNRRLEDDDLQSPTVRLLIVKFLPRVGSKLIVGKFDLNRYRTFVVEVHFLCRQHGRSGAIWIAKYGGYIFRSRTGDQISNLDGCRTRSLDADRTARRHFRPPASSRSLTR